MLHDQYWHHLAQDMTLYEGTRPQTTRTITGVPLGSHAESNKPLPPSFTARTTARALLRDSIIQVTDYWLRTNYDSTILAVLQESGIQYL
jgi:hypothetical protein